DNHAWVEVWVDGKWHFIGACEPDADLDLAWFTKPAKRAMLVNTTVFGDYEGPEDVLVKDTLFTRINVLQNYAPVKRVFARVVNPDGSAADSAAIEFQLYNYAEFYPLFRTVTDSKGLASFTTGFGDLVVWAAMKGRYGFARLDVRNTDTLTLSLNRTASDTLSVDFDLIPPAEADAGASVTDAQREKNNQRLSAEDGLRRGYEETFIDSLKAVRFARLVKLDPDTLWQFLRQSRGNWRTLTQFAMQVPEVEKGFVFPILYSLSEKDLRDVDTTVLFDVLLHSPKPSAVACSQEDYQRYILSPRVDNEYLRPYRQIFTAVNDPSFSGNAGKNPMRVAAWVRQNVILNNRANYGRAPLTPSGVFALRVSDGHSADILFVAICRSLGIPARLDPATRVPEYLSKGTWQEILLFDKAGTEGTKGEVTLVNDPANAKKPEYTIHYTLEEFKDGFFRTLDYEGSPLVKDFPCPLQIPAGPCLMVTGSRLAEGTVLAHLRVFTVAPGKPVVCDVQIRKSPAKPANYGTVDPRQLGDDLRNGMIVAWIDPGKEPTRHLLADFKEKKEAFGRWKGKIVLVLPQGAAASAFPEAEKRILPANIGVKTWDSFPLTPVELRAAGKPVKNLPIVIFVTREGVIHYLSEGYRIGTGDDLATLIKAAGALPPAD
ncbi:MAG TPA: transglutaminase family protein, partial [Bacteroidales bacterium]|nr:transglutaminase family protein [Bacteroidales bacterium]